MLVDQRDRTYLMTLEVGGTYHTHSGTLPHDESARAVRKASASRPRRAW